jgi:hypothetical protein
MDGVQVAFCDPCTADAVESGIFNLLVEDDESWEGVA